MTTTTTTPSTYSTTTPVTHRPTWATSHHMEESGIMWEHTVSTNKDGDLCEVLQMGVELACQDFIAFDSEGALSLRRGPIRVIVGDDDVTPEAARQLVNDLTEALRLLDEE